MPAEGGTGFDLTEVERGIAGTRFAGWVQHFASVGSTNQLALDAAAAGARDGVWVADEQTAGRGRGGHHWHSAAGDGLYVSALVRPQLRMSDAAKIPLATGLAAQAAILETTGLSVDIRWPNDLMFGERKCGGILVESVADGSAELRYAVVGVGINVNHQAFPGDLARVATSLFIESERRFEREPLLAALLAHLDRELAGLERPDSDLLARFSVASSWVNGKRVTVDEGGGYTGWTRGLDGQGFLRVQEDTGVIRTVLSGGVRSARG
jgi:BirA family biotin operon repressor/biotin-[acetyl-CoA-carboxylase] ligase